MCKSRNDKNVCAETVMCACEYICTQHGMSVVIAALIRGATVVTDDVEIGSPQ